MSSQYEYDPTRVSGSGEIVHGTAGEAIADRAVCSVGADGLYYQADSDLAARMPAFGMAMSAMTTGQRGEFLVKGFIGLSTWAWTPGSELYVSGTAGQMAHAAGGIRQEVGVAFTATQIFIRPQGIDSETGCALLPGSTAYVGFDNCKGAAHSNYFVCDGVADQVQINLAIAYVIGVGGGSVELEEGAYSLTDEVDVTASDITLRGQGFNTQLTQTAVDGSETIRVYGLVGAHVDHVIIENLRLIGNANSGDGIWMRYCDHGIIRDCWFSAHGNHGIYSNYNWYSTIENNYCYDNDNHGINSAGGNYNVIIGNSCNFNANSGISIDETSTVIDNVCWDNVAWDGITVLDGSDQSIVSNNECLQNTRHGITLSNVSEVLVSDNVCYDNDNYGIAEVAAALDNIVLDNNCLENDTGGLLLIGAGTRALGNKVDGTNSIAVDVVIPEVNETVENPDSNIGRHPTEQMIDNVETTVRLGFSMPLDFQQVVSAQVIVVSAASGNLRWDAFTDFGKPCATEDYNTHNDTVGATTTAVTLNDLECIDVSAALTGALASDRVGLEFWRDGDDALDTIGDTVYVVAFRLRYL